MPQQSVARFFDHSLDLNCLANMDGIFVELNKQWSVVLGYSLDDLKSKPFMEYVHPDDVDSTIQAMSQLGDSQEVLHFRNRYRKADGTYTWLEWNSYPPDTDSGFIFATARCIDYLVASEEELSRKNAVLTTIMKAQDGFIRNGPTVYLWDYVLSSLIKITGSTYGFIGEVNQDEHGPSLQLKALCNHKTNPDIYSQVQGTSWDELKFRDSTPFFGRCLRETSPWFVKGSETELEADNTHENFVGIPIRDESGTRGVIGLGNRQGGYPKHIITELDSILSFLGSIFFSVALVEDAKKTRQDLVEAKALQDTVLETVQSGIIVLEEDGTIALLNEKARQFLRGLRLRVPKTKRGVAEWLEYWFVQDDETMHLFDFLLQTEQRTSKKFALQAFDNANETIHNPIDVSAAWLSPNGDLYPLLLTITDRSESIELIKREEANTLLEEKIHQLRETREHNEILSECVEYLQACTSQAEGLELISKYLNRFYPDRDDGVLYGMFDPNINTFQLAEQSGPKFSTSNHTFERTAVDCWALRSRRVYAYWETGHRLACKHKSDDTVLEFCVPLFSLDRVVAVFSISYSNMTIEEAEKKHNLRIAEYTSLSQSLSGALSTIALRESLQRLALTDELTKLPNRRSFQDSVKRRLALARRNKSSFILAMMDIDHFKQINDTYGHDTGDRVLKEMGRLITTFFRTEDLYGRVGGEEFALFLGQCTAEEAKQRFTILLQEISNRVKLPDRDVTVSLGFVSNDPEHPSEEYSDLLQHADQALYFAKEHGRNQWAYYPETPS